MPNTFNITNKKTTTLLNRQITKCQRIAVLELAPRLNAVFWRCNSVEGHGILWGSRSLNVLIWLYQKYTHNLPRLSKYVNFIKRTNPLTQWSKYGALLSHGRYLRSPQWNNGSIGDKIKGLYVDFNESILIFNDIFYATCFLILTLYLCRSLSNFSAQRHV